MASCVFRKLLPVYKSSPLEEDIFQPDFSESILQEEMTVCVTDAVVDRWLVIMSPVNISIFL